MPVLVINSQIPSWLSSAEVLLFLLLMCSDDNRCAPNRFGEVSTRSTAIIKVSNNNN